jgi:uncharacterized protein (DUF1330 family)
MALVALSAVSAAAIVHGLHAQSKPPVYYVAELEMLNADAMKEWGGMVERSIKKMGGKYVVRGTNITALEGTPPKQLIITRWDSMDALKAWYDGPYKDMRPMRDKAHKSVRAYAVEGVAN